MSTWWRGMMLSVLVSVAAVLAARPVLTAEASTTSANTKQSQINKQISSLQNQVNEVSGDEADLLNRLNTANDKKVAVERQINDLQGQINEVQAEFDAANTHLRELQQDQQGAQAKLEKARIALAVSTEQMQNQAVDAYIGTEPSTNLAMFVLKARDMREVSAASEYMHQIVADQGAVVEAHRELEGQAKDLSTQIAGAQKQVQAQQNVIKQHQNQLSQQGASLDALHQQAVDEANQQTALVAEVESKKATFQQQINDLQAQSDAIGAQLRGLGASSLGAPPAGEHLLAMPTPGAAYTSPFGMRVDPVTHVLALHAGQDFGAKTGTPIHAAADGTVAIAGWVTGYGNYTCINHPALGISTCYGHQSQLLVTVGQYVAKGDVIGLVGSTGYSTGPHLHFEVRINGIPVDPLPYL